MDNLNKILIPGNSRGNLAVREVKFAYDYECDCDYEIDDT